VLADPKESAIDGDREAAVVSASKNQRHLALAAYERAFTASQELIGQMLRCLSFSLLTSREGTSHPD